MKFLRDRKEIAQEINIKRTPVITIDIRECMDGYENCYEGDKVRIETKDGYACRCTVEMFRDDPGNQCYSTPWLYQTIRLQQGCCCISDSFGLHDVDEMVEWSNAKLLHAGERVIVYFRSKDNAYLRVMKIGERISRFCQTVTNLKDIDAD